MTSSSSLESLPNEILLSVLALLEPRDITTLQLQSRRLLRLCRDNVFWRQRCHDDSSFLEGINVRRRSRSSFIAGQEIDLDLDNGGETVEHVVRGGQESRRADGGGGAHPSREPRSTRAADYENVRLLANWDPTFPGEEVNWYDEYIQRNGPIVVSWFEQPQIRDGNMRDMIEVEGVALFQPRQDVHELLAVSPLDDGSICLWDVKGTHQKKGSILSKSQPGTLSITGTTRSKMASIGVTECVSVDSLRKRGYFAVSSHIVEVDLETLQVVGHQPFEWTITTMSTAHPSVPLTVGTLHGVHMYDSRFRSGIKREHQEKLDQFSPFGVEGYSQLLDPRPLPPYAPLAQSGPQSILHFEQAGIKGSVSADILVAGRFSNILQYDRRMFPSIKGSLHSGARLCSMTSLPYPFSCVDSDLRRGGELSIEQIEKARNSGGGRTLIACGEYNTKGSLEVYGMSESTDCGPGGANMIQTATMKNRQTASESKLLSVINHGTRILFSDGQGCLRWMERDGFTEVRRHKIGHGEKVAHRSLFASMPGSDEIARKILGTRTTGEGSTANDDDVLFWTGEKLGLVSFSSRPGFAADEFEENTRTPEEIAEEEKEQLYGERMRSALKRQANDVRFVRYLGAGIRHGV